MTDTERIIEAVHDEFLSAPMTIVSTEQTPLTAAIVNLALSGVCPLCYSTERPVCGDFTDNDGVRQPIRCPNPHHDHREALDALLAERECDAE